MESRGRVLDESKTDAAIADLMNSEKPGRGEPASKAPAAHAVFPDLMPPEPQAPERDAQSGFGAILRQKWTEFSGAA